MITAVSLLEERHRKCPFVVRWHGEPDVETGKQKRYGRSFESIREARVFLAQKQAELDRGTPRDPVDVTLECLVDEFAEARLSTLSHASKSGYGNTTDQMLAYFGRERRVRDIQRRQAEAFIATRQRCDGRPGELSSWSRVRHLIHCRAIFGAAVEWGYTDHNPFRATRSSGNSPLRLQPKGRPWPHITPEEFARLQRVVPTARQRAAYWLMYGCGLRPGEVYNIVIANVDLHAGRRYAVRPPGVASIRIARLIAISILFDVRVHDLGRVGFEPLEFREIVQSGVFAFCLNAETLFRVDDHDVGFHGDRGGHEYLRISAVEYSARNASTPDPQHAVAFPSATLSGALDRHVRSHLWAAPSRGFSFAQVQARTVQTY